jgi:hypothetical protein
MSSHPLPQGVTGDDFLTLYKRCMAARLCARAMINTLPGAWKSPSLVASLLKFWPLLPHQEITAAVNGLAATTMGDATTASCAQAP